MTKLKQLNKFNSNSGMLFLFYRFGFHPDDTEVDIDGNACTDVQVTDNDEITCTTPAGKNAF